jgi:hypothetical protein
MERHGPERFEQARLVIEPILEELGFHLAEEHYYQRAFGSAYTVYGRRNSEVRLAWDGRDDTFIVECRSADGDWIALEPTRASDGDIGPGEIARIADAVRARFTGGRSSRGVDSDRS